MKFNRKLQKTIIFKRSSSHHSRKKLSNNDLSIQIHNIKNFKKKFRFSFIKNFIWHKKKHISTTKLPLISSLSSPRIEELQNEFMNVLKKMCIKSEIQTYQQRKYSILSNLMNINHFSKEIIQEYNLYHQTKFHTHNRLLITRSVDNFTTKSIEHYLYSSLSSEPIHQSFLKNIIKRTNNSLIKIPLELIANKRNSPLNISIKSESCLKKPNSFTHSKLSLNWNENSLKSTSKQQQQEAAIIDIEYPSSSSINSIKPLEKSYSSPLPIKTNHLSFSNNYIQSAHIINQYQYENKSKISLYSSINEMENDESMESISSDEENVKSSLLKYQENIHMKNLRHRWSLFDVWRKTMTKLPSTLNCIWREKLYHTGSREFLLEYDQMLPMNNNQANFVQEQRYIEQERPLKSHIGLALLALLIFPPVGIVAMLLSLWSLCGQQDRDLSRKFGNAVYWISLLSICLSFLLLLTLFTYFTYEYLINRSIITSQSLTTYRPLIKDIDYI